MSTTEKAKLSQTNKAKSKGSQPSQQSVAKQQYSDDYWPMDDDDDLDLEEVIAEEASSRKTPR